MGLCRQTTATVALGAGWRLHGRVLVASECVAAERHRSAAHASGPPSAPPSMAQVEATPPT